MNDNDDFNPFDTDETELVTADRQPATILPRDEQTAFDAAEAVIREGLQAFYMVGTALIQIKTNRWYRAKGYTNFVAYCHDVWGIRNSHAYRLMDAASIVDDLKTSPIGDVLPVPDNESQVRPLARLETAEERREAWQRANERAEAEGRPVTARDASDAAMDLRASANGVAPSLFNRKPEPQAEDRQSQDVPTAGQGSLISTGSHNFKPEAQREKSEPSRVNAVLTAWAHTLRYQLLRDNGDSDHGVITVRPARESENALPGRFMVEVNGTVKQNAQDLAEGMQIAERIAEGLKYK